MRCSGIDRGGVPLTEFAFLRQRYSWECPHPHLGLIPIGAQTAKVTLGNLDHANQPEGTLDDDSPAQDFLRRCGGAPGLTDRYECQRSIGLLPDLQDPIQLACRPMRQLLQGKDNREGNRPDGCHVCACAIDTRDARLRVQECSGQGVRVQELSGQGVWIHELHGHGGPLGLAGLPLMLRLRETASAIS